MGSERCKGIGVKLVKTTSASTAKLCIDIPEWLLIEVLIRLPVKQVFKFKLVCKQWLSVISDHSFIHMYVSRASTWTFISPTVQSDCCKYELLKDVYSQDLKFPYRYVLPCPFSGQPDWKFYKIVGVSNGLVLYGPPEHKEKLLNYNICNPITRQWISLPPHGRFSFFRRGFITSVENGTLTSYRVVRVQSFPIRYKAIRFEVFVSEIGEWKNYTIPSDREIGITRRSMRPTALHGILHWITLEHFIIAYDPYHKPDSVRFIELPADMHASYDELDKVFCGVCDVYQEHLRCFEISKVSITPYGFSSFCVWILDDYSTEDWRLQHRINAADILYDDFLSSMRLLLMPISFHPFDPDIFYLVNRPHFVVSFNIKTQKLEALRNPTNVRLPPGGWCSAIPFVIPPWPTYIAPLSFGVSKD